MRTNKTQKDKMAPWRKDLPDLPERWREEESDGDNSSTDVSRTFSKRYSPASFDTYSPDNDKRTDSNESGTGVSEQSEVCSSKKRSERDGEAYGKSDIFSRTRKIRRTQKYMLMCLKNWTKDIKMVASRSA